MKTDKDNGIYNGEIGVIVNMETNYRFTVDFDGRKARFVRASFLRDEQNPYSKDLKGRQVLDFGYAVTCHKVQGSQFDEVLIFDSHGCDARWMYTAVTRAIKKGEIAG
jgi:exodeoxyribonuclease-5